MACGCISRKTAKIILGISIFLLLLSIVSIFIFQTFYNKILKEDIALTQGSLITKIWEDIPLPIYEKLYFFNITNKDQFLEGLEPLNVTEVGPYTYKSRWVKPNPQWNENNTVSYRETRTYQFMRNMSVGSEDDKIITLNGPMIIGANVISPGFRPLFDLFCRGTGEKLVIEKSVKELAYQGYDDSIIKRAWLLKPDLPYKEGKFCWLYGKNDTNDGLFTVYTGADDETKTNFINNWNGNEKLTFWDDDSCNMLNGTSIETGPPIKNEQDTYTFFQSFFCRSLTFKYTEDTKHYDVTAKRFKPTYSIFANSTENPDNHCFEVKKERPSGLLDISRCQFDAPVFVSFPHFHLADPSYLNSVNGLEPNENKHGCHIDVEPITGLSIDLAVRFQINIEIEKLSFFPLFNTVTKGVFPVFWAELSLKIDEDLATFLKHKVRDPKIIAYTLISVLLLIGWIGLMVSVVALCTSEKTDEEKSLLINSEKLPRSPNCCDSSKMKENEVKENEKKMKSYESVNNIHENIETDFHKSELNKSIAIDV